MTKLRHVGIVVRDLPKALAFYKQLGFGAVAQEWSSDSTDKGTISMIKLDNQIELVSAHWMNHFALTVDSLDKFELPSKPIFSKETDTVKVCYITDPSGNVIELVEEK